MKDVYSCLTFVNLMPMTIYCEQLTWNKWSSYLPTMMFLLSDLKYRFNLIEMLHMYVRMSVAPLLYGGIFNSRACLERSLRLALSCLP